MGGVVSTPAPSAPPLVEREMYVKSISFGELSEANRELFSRAFPRFFEEPRDPNADVVGNPHTPPSTRIQAPFHLRRFSGGAHISHGNYYSICVGASGNSYQTLAMELLAYVGGDTESIYEVADLADENLKGLRQNLSPAQREFAESRGWRVLSIYERPVILTQYQSPQEAHAEGVIGQFYVVPYSVRRLSRQKVFDMREKDAMRWLMDTLWDNFPIGVFSDYQTARADATAEEPIGHDPKVLLFPDDSDQLSRPPWLRPYPVRKRLLESIPEAHCGLSGIFGENCGVIPTLEFILTSSLGGSPLDEMIAAYLQECGADGCIYPSARFDCGVVYGENGTVKTSWGWNFVDYKDSPPSGYHNHVWWFEGVSRYAHVRGSFELDLTPEVLSDSRCVSSWALHGCAVDTRRRVKSLAWEPRLTRGGPDIELPEPTMIERLPWLGYVVGYRPRKPRLFHSFFDLRLGLIEEEISLDSSIISPAGFNGDSVGAILCYLSQSHDLWKTGVRETLTAEGFWALMQILPSKEPALICPCCASISALNPARVLFCHVCGFGHTSDRSAQRVEQIFDLIELCLDELSATSG